MTTIYCDMSSDSSQKICAWGCILIHANNEYIYSGHNIMKKVLPVGELYAIIQALEKLSSFEAHDVTIYTDYEIIVSDYNSFINKTSQKLKGEYAYLFQLLSQYFLKYNLTISKIARSKNPAHKIAYSELKKALENPNIEIVTIPKLDKTRKPGKRKQKPRTIIKSCLPHFT